MSTVMQGSRCLPSRKSRMLESTIAFSKTSLPSSNSFKGVCDSAKNCRVDLPYSARNQLFDVISASSPVLDLSRSHPFSQNS